VTVYAIAFGGLLLNKVNPYLKLFTQISLEMGMGFIKAQPRKYLVFLGPFCDPVKK
jgi:hypothetical protein